ncbi:hypothetical protein ACFXDJ_31460 [Streptomyces sp. NPDC059443]|uniref:hypothetical protein n=1 Tax=unclassified Streptomyces TaxID=2593676 RepID=UPI0036CB5FCE
MSYYLRFFFEVGAHTPLWPGPPGDPELDSPYGYPCELERLPISSDIQAELARLADWYYSSLDWEYPPNPSPWPKEQQELFTRQADAALEILRRELGDAWTVEDRRQQF